MISTILLTYLSIRSFVSPTSANSKNLGILPPILQHSVNKLTYYPTIRVVVETTSINFCWETLEFQNWLPGNVPLLVGNKKPLQKNFDPRLVSTGRMRGYNEVFRYAVLFCTAKASELEPISAIVKGNVNRRWDKVIFVAKDRPLLDAFMASPLLQDLRDKFFVSLDSADTVWVDPMVYNEGKTIPVSSLEAIPNRDKMGGNLHGRHLYVAGSDFKPWVYREEDGNGGWIFRGSNVHLIEVASEIFNFTFSFPTYDISYGDYFPANDSWTGMYSHIFYPEGGCHLTTFLGYDFGWSYGVDYPTSFSTCGVVFMLNQPITALKWYAFILPFDPLVWIGIIVSFVFLGIMQFIMMFFLHGWVVDRVVVDSSAFLPYAMAMEQGLCDIPKGARYICLVWLLACTVFGTGYKATLRQNLSFPRAETIPLTYEELAERPEYTIILNKMGSLEVEYFRTSTSPAMKNIQSRLSVDENAERAIRKTYMKPYSAVIGWSSAMIQEVARLLTVNTRVDPLALAKYTPKVNTMSMGFQKDSIFVDSFRGITEGSFVSGLMYLWEDRENFRFKQKGIQRLNGEKETELYAKLMKQARAEDPIKSLAMDNLLATFLVLPLGFFMSAIFYGLEAVVYLKHNGMDERAGWVYQGYIKRWKHLTASYERWCVWFFEFRANLYINATILVNKFRVV